VNTTAFGTQPVVQVVDAGGNVVDTAGVAITASLAETGANLTNSGAASVTGGSATFSGLAATGLAGSYTLRFTATGLGSVAAAFTLTPGAPTGIELATPPSFSTPAAVNLPRQPAVRLRDVSGNTVPQAGVNVTVSVSGGTATLQGATTVATDGAGLATFTDLGITSPRGPHLLSFAAPSFASITAGDSTIVALPIAFATPVTDTASVDQEHEYVFELLQSDTLLVVQISGGQGTADLLVRYGDAPHWILGRFDCYPRIAGSEETCVFRNPTPGLWYVTILAFPFSFVGVNLTVNSYP
jgi:hypothetical protein